MNYITKRHFEKVPSVNRFPWFTFLFIAAVFFLMAHDFYHSRMGSEAYDLSKNQLVSRMIVGSLRRRIALLALGLFALGCLFRHRRTRLRLNGPLTWTMFFFAGWSLLSIVWAQDSALAMRRLGTFAILCLAAIAIARCCSFNQIVLLIFSWTLLFLLIGVSAEIALGTFRPFAAGYRFAGTLHPNHQGINCALLLISGVATADIIKRRRMLFVICALLGLAFLILTESRTAFAAAMISLALYLTVTYPRKAKITLGLGLATSFCVFLLLTPDTPLSALQKVAYLGREGISSQSFNGRNGIWEECRYYVGQHPLLGYGYGAFWTPDHITEVSDAVGWGVSEGHSAYLDCVLNLGFVGLVTYLLVLLLGICRAFALFRLAPNPVFAFSGSLLVFCVLDGVLESIILYATFLMFLSMVTAIRLTFPRPSGQYE